jgi:hypothetical protein
VTPVGTDLIVEGPTSADDWWVLMFEVRQRWPEALFHRTDPGEMLVFRDQEAFRRGLGADEETAGRIHVRMGPERLTLVVDEQATEGARVGRELVTALQRLRGG